ncbi:MAG: 23S rRNA (uracil(1939)-C(5))-methyltransferase RlmD [Firmicutes bacterium]|nr:23S rRNA (uracil(1939)-C(5))-methyltransferase RlmD [Bacillota bacterium]
MSVLEKGLQYRVDIFDVSTDGRGIGRIDGAAVFVEGALPGDTVVAELVHIKKNYLTAKTVEILTPSPDRRESFCPLAGECGGCSLQEMDYEGQLRLKEKWVVDKLTRIGGISSPKVHPIIGMEEPFRYRNKAQYALGRVQGAEKKSQGCNVGFYKAGSKRVVNCRTCPIQTEAAERLAAVLRSYVKNNKVPVYDPVSGTGLLRGLVVRSAFGTGSVMAILVATAKRLPNQDELIMAMDDALDGDWYLESVVLNVNKSKTGEVLGRDCITLAGHPVIRDEACGLKFEISPLSFYQVNPEQMEVLYGKVGEYAALTGTETVLDLYCGAGSIGLSLARDAKKVVGIEVVKSAVVDANRNAVINGIINAEFILGKAEEVVPAVFAEENPEAEDAAEVPEHLADAIRSADVVILDPPRQGCQPELLEAVLTIDPEKIVYVSCDPATLARDIKFLTANGYEFREAQPVDMFPHSSHVEVVTWLQKVQG